MILSQACLPIPPFRHLVSGEAKIKEKLSFAIARQTLKKEWLQGTPTHLTAITICKGSTNNQTIPLQGLDRTVLLPVYLSVY